MKLGRIKSKEDPRDLKYKDYAISLPTPVIPFQRGTSITDWLMLGNDQYGDCVWASGAHQTMLWTTEGEVPVTFTEKGVLSDYSAVTGFNPNDPNSDQGTEIRDALKYRQQTGMVDSKGNRHKIGAYLALDYTNLNEIIEAAYIFHSVEIGINFPDTAMTQFDNGEPWTVVNPYNIEGGHDVPILIGFDGTWLYVVTWGKVQKMSTEFFLKFCDEAWVILSQEFLYGGKSPEGFDLPTLQADFSAITNTPIPEPPEPTPVPPTPQPPSQNYKLAIQDIKVVLGTTTIATKTAVSRIKAIIKKYNV